MRYIITGDKRESMGVCLQVQKFIYKCRC